MNDFMDNLWFFIENIIAKTATGVDAFLSPLEFLGPEVLIFLLALFAIIFSSLIKKVYTTKRYIELKKNFEYWHSLREEAMAHKEKEKGKAIAKNIDQAELNRAYYDYFFEGLLKSLVTTWLPLFVTLAYVDRSYAPSMLAQRFGKLSLFMAGDQGIFPWEINGIFWFFISLLFLFIGISYCKMIIIPKFCKTFQI